jgi:Ca-activated chloride channel homolog
VSFASPWLLALLLLVPLAAAAYVVFDRSRRRAAEQFVSPALMASVAPRRPGWRRHVPILFYAVALAIGIAALAKPERTVAVPERQAAVVLATDTSGSMEATDVPPSRLDAVKRAATTFLGDAPRGLRVGAVVFNHGVRSVESPATDRAPVRDIVEDLRPSGGTATGEGLDTALKLLSRQESKRKLPGAVVLLSDGESTHGRDPIEVAREARRLKIPIHTVALGTDAGTIEVERPDGGTELRPVPPDRDTLREIAELSGGRTFEADQADELTEVYEDLGARIARREEQRQMASTFAAGAAALIALGGFVSLRWFGRVP